MRLDRALSLATDRVTRARGRGPTAVPVLMYHSVSIDPETGTAPYYRVTISPERFRSQVQWLADQGYRAVRLDEWLDSTTTRSAQERTVVITFDDGYADFLRSAWPALQAHRMTATVFLPSAHVGDTRRQFKGRDCLTRTEVRELATQGVCFGSHTVSHPVLHGMDWSAIRAELADSRVAIEDMLGAPVTTFAYPYAFPQHDTTFASRLRDVLTECGYRGSVTTVIGRHRPDDDPLCIKRLPMNEADDPALFAAKLRGAYDWVGTIQGAWKRLRYPAGTRRVPR